MLRVAFPFQGNRVGGSHISGMLLAAELAGYSDVQATVILHEEGLLADYLRSRDIPYRHLPTRHTGAPFTKVNYARTLATDLPRMVGFLRRGEYDVVHTNDSALHVTWGVAARLAGAWHVWHQRGLKWPRTPLNDWSRTALVAISEYVDHALPTHPFADRLMTYNPFEVDGPPPDRARLRADLVDELRVDSSTPLVGFVSNLRDYKRPDFFLDVAARLALRHPDAHFVVAGAEYDVPLSGLRQQAEEAGIAPRIHFLGFRLDAQEVMAALDVLVVPAVGEPFGRTLVEAFVAGTPVVAAASGGHLEIMSASLARWLVAVDAPDAFAERVSVLLDDRALSNHVAAVAQRHARDTFGASRHAADIVALYRRLVLPPRVGSIRSSVRGLRRSSQGGR